MATDPKCPKISDGEGWNVHTLKIFYDRQRDHDKELATERDRRYAEVNIEKEKALKIKEEADKTALDLAREIQVYKDEKANELREQINSERGSYVTRLELEPIKNFISGLQAKSTWSSTMMVIVGAIAGAILAVMVQEWIHSIKATIK